MGFKATSKERYEIRKTLYNRQSGKCYFCHTQLSMIKEHSNFLTIDHFVPKSRGGKNKLSNYVGACNDCNHKKGCKIWDKPKTKSEVVKIPQI